MPNEPDLRRILQLAFDQRASDIHFRVGEPPVLRIKGELLNVKTPPFTGADLGVVCRMLLSSSATSVDLTSVQEIDGSFEVTGLCRFRFNIFRYEGKLGAVLRLIPTAVPTLADLGFPDILKKIAAMDRGFILITGATGQGKSTTLAALIDHLNTTRRAHIVTIEDPIEFVHQPKRCKITQREVGRDTASFADALRSALRQDPDIISVGEMRDAESVDIALKAAETGHVVFSTIHTTDAAKTIGRLVSIFPSEQQGLVRLRLADCLRATISQRLLARADGSGRVAAQEIMIVNTAIAECISSPERTAEIPQFIEKSSSLTGAQTFQQSLVGLYRSHVITLDVAKQASGHAADFEHALNYEKNETDTSAQGAIRPTTSSSTLELDNHNVVLDRRLRALRPEDSDDEATQGGQSGSLLERVMENAGKMIKKS